MSSPPMPAARADNTASPIAIARVYGMKAVTPARDATLETPVGSEWRKFARGGAWCSRADARQAQGAPHDGRHDGGLAGLSLLTIIRHDNLRFTGQCAHRRALYRRFVWESQRRVGGVSASEFRK